MLFRNTYRIPSARRPDWDYAKAGFYFVTICTKHRVCYFGEIAQTRVVLSDIGEIAVRTWLAMEQQFSFVQLDDFVVMPNHLHGIVQIKTPETNRRNAITGDAITGDAITRVSTGGATGAKNPMVERDSLSCALRWYKGRVTFEANATKREAPFVWQTRFHDRILRSETEWLAAREYIRTNPENWPNDAQNT